MNPLAIGRRNWIKKDTRGTKHVYCRHIASLRAVGCYRVADGDVRAELGADIEP